MYILFSCNERYFFINKWIYHMSICTRIAPSPTGDPHVGTAYIALFNWMFARQQGGKFILRIEDTDQLRSTKQAEIEIINSLKWLGLDWDEGPDVGGEHGPYRQSERKQIYQQHADLLLKNNHAFKCFCTPERLDTLRQQQKENKENTGYDGCCLKLTEQQIAEKQNQGLPFVVRMKKPETGECQITDMLRGEIAISWHNVDMQILMKTDGLPTYHLANVVDDHLMGVTHIIRGEEWLNSAPKHKLLYEYFGWEMPELCHMPLLRNPDKSKLSKRKNPTSINYYRDMGFLPEALINYLANLGWSMPNEEEKFTLEQMQQCFDISRISLGGPIFDKEKLEWLNARWIRENLTNEQFFAQLTAKYFNKEYLDKFLDFAKQRVNKISDFGHIANFMLVGDLKLQPEAFTHKKLTTEQIKTILQFSLWQLETMSVWNRENILAVIKALATKLEIKLGEFNFPLFVAIAGTSDSWSVMDSIEILGKALACSRLKNAITLLGGISKKSLKQMQKQYEALDLV
jgi:glutamyl-tRNA synthetase